jgi:hypothetical protein
MARRRLEVKQAYEAEPRLRFQAFWYAGNNAVYTSLGWVEQVGLRVRTFGCGVPRYLFWVVL